MTQHLLKSPYVRIVTEREPIRITPGPFDVSPAVLEAGSRAIVGHRTGEFREVLRANADMLLAAFELEARSEYGAVVLTGTGSAAMEAMVSSTAPSWTPLVLVNGRFGRRLADMAQLHNRQSIVLSFGSGEPVNLARVQEELDRYSHVAALMFCVQDTRDCILNPFVDLCLLARQRGLKVFVDATSAGIAEEIYPDRLGVDLFTESSGKGIRGLQGLAIICGRRDLFLSLRDRPRNSYYLDLYEHYKVQHSRCEPRFAPATSLHFALNQALKELLEEGVANRRDVIRRRTSLVRECLLEHGLLLLRPPDQMPHSITSLLLPSGVGFSCFQQALKRRGFLVYNGSSVVEDCFQVGTAGYLTDDVLQEALSAIRGLLSRERQGCVQGEYND